MSRRMSCSLTTDAVRQRTKTVTRRHVDTWWDLSIGDRLTLVEKAMGLPKGARQVVLAEVEVVDVAVCQLRVRFPGDAAAEGFPEWSWDEFVEFFCRTHRGVTPESLVRRIEWRYLDPTPGSTS